MKAAALALLAALPAFAAPPPRIAVQPLGGVPDATIRDLCDDLSRVFDAEFVARPRKPLPAEAFYPPRRRYRALAILDWLQARRGGGEFRILGVTDRDISTPKPPYEDWGIFGIAYLGGEPAVVSTFRLRRRGPAGVSPRVRLFRVAVHELGHTFGLEHCDAPRCIMSDARGAIRSVDEGERFCPRCRRAIAERLKPPPNPALGPE